MYKGSEVARSHHVVSVRGHFGYLFSEVSYAVKGNVMFSLIIQ